MVGDMWGLFLCCILFPRLYSYWLFTMSNPNYFRWDKYPRPHQLVGRNKVTLRYTSMWQRLIAFSSSCWNPTGFQEPSREMSHRFEKQSHSGSFIQVFPWNVSRRTFEVPTLCCTAAGVLRTGWFPTTLLGATGTLGSSRMCHSLCRALVLCPSTAEDGILF